MKFNVHAGHNRIVQGASKYLNEVAENRKVKDEVIRLLKLQGHTVYDCTDAIGVTQNQNLSRIVSKCNSNKVDLDISIHLNSGGGAGVEVYTYDNETKTHATRICEKISKSLGIKNRGVKNGKNMYVLKNTKSQAILVECCFVDSKIDKTQWNAKQCALAIVEAILNKSIIETPSTQPFLIKVANVKKNDVLNIREKPDANSKKTGYLKYNDPNKYTITEVKDGWGKLKSGVGWINLYYTKKV